MPPSTLYIRHLTVIGNAGCLSAVSVAVIASVSIRAFRPGCLLAFAMVLYRVGIGNKKFLTFVFLASFHRWTEHNLKKCLKGFWNFKDLTENEH